ncbi:MAG: NTP transferase domain-containing protein [Clostridia bacterium]|nr:NTP transferase domain-containing protein [Clostridia bacterium]
MNHAAILLCAGKGTRMNDDSKNKVCFECAGIPVIKRIIANMRLGGVSRFVVVVGHQSRSVMDCLDGEPGVVYAYQKEQKGTGHAALCGLKALDTVGYSGPVIVSMGDKIISADVISSLIERAGRSRAVWGVQPVGANPGGGRVVVKDGKPYGVVELTDAAFMTLADLQPEEYADKLEKIGLNEKKAQKVLKLIKERAPEKTKRLGGEVFTADEILSSPFANAGLYCFDVSRAIEAIETFNASNAQGEIYLTDALEWFSKNSSVELYEVKSASDMLTYSTKPELRSMGLWFMRSASEFRSDITAGRLDGEFERLYGDGSDGQKERYTALIDKFIAQFGDRKVIITRAPGRLNLMGRHVDHRGGGINVMATDTDTVFISSPREDDVVNISNVDPAYPDRRFSISELMGETEYEKWTDFLEDKRVKELLGQSRGDWSNYVKSAVLRVQFDSDMPLCGMDTVAAGNNPVGAGLSSSSSIVVAAMEAVVSLNCLNYTDREFVELCGEGEWFVGSRGGAGDHAAMKCGKRGKITHLGFKPFEIGDSASFSDKYAILVANSMIQAKKSEGCKDTFNAKVASYEIAFMILKREFPEYDLREFRDIAAIRPYSAIYKMLKAVPETMTRGSAKALLPEYREKLDRIFESHADPQVYDLRGVALFGISECARSDGFMEALDGSDYELIGRMMKISHDGDRIGAVDLSDEVLDRLAEENADIALQSGAYGCSTVRIDELSDLLNGTDGVLGSELVGAGLGGCVIALVERDKADAIIERINKEYYDYYGYGHGANVFTSACGSSVLY